MNIFHVHTYRCDHAENVSDEVYVKKAIELGASDIWFTDHAPFPSDPFGSRMDYDELEEYLDTLRLLKQKHTDITIHIGLEAEYFPHFDAEGYYKHLRSLPELEMLLLGQHMAQVSDAPPAYSFSESTDFLNENEYKLLGKAIVQGAESGYFDVIAHPDRIFRRRTVWDTDMEAVSNEIIQAAIKADIPLEMNLSSVENPENYKRQFWQLVPDKVKRVTGFDVHSLNEMESRYMGIAERLTTALHVKSENYTYNEQDKYNVLGIKL